MHVHVHVYTYMNLAVYVACVQYLDDFNMSSSKEMKLVFFMDAIEHVSRYVHFDVRYSVCIGCKCVTILTLLTFSMLSYDQ